MRTADFDFDLPERLIALRPASPRDSARLLLVPPDGALEDRRVVVTQIAAEGLALLDTLVPTLDAYVSTSLEHLDRHAQETLIRLLEEARAPYTGEPEGQVEEGQETHPCGQAAI